MIKVIFHNNGYKLWQEQYRLVNENQYQWLFQFMKADILAILNFALDNLEKFNECNTEDDKPHEKQILKEVVRRIMVLHPFFSIGNNGYDVIGDNADNLAVNLYSLLNVQKRLNSWAYILLDADNKYFDGLSIQDRINIYGFLANSRYNVHEISNDDRIISDISFKEDIYFANPDHNVSRFKDSSNREHISSSQMNAQIKLLDRLEQSYCNEEMEDDLKKHKQLLLKKLSDIKSDNYLVREFQFDSFELFIKYEFSRILENKAFIRKCRQCGTYFVISDLKEFYCENYNEEFGCKCKEIPANRRYRKKLKDLGIISDWDWAENFTKNNKKNKYYPNKNSNEILNKVWKCFEEIKKNKPILLQYNTKEEAEKHPEYDAFLKNISKLRVLAEELKKQS